MRFFLILLFLCYSVNTAPAQSSSLQDTENETHATRLISFETTEGTELTFDVSPDGQWIIFDLLGQLWRLPAEGGDAVPLTDAVRYASDDRDPNFSPDGRWIVFQSHRDGGTGLWLLPAEGGEPQKLAGAEIEGMPRWRPYVKTAWSPDSRRIAYGFGWTIGELRLHDLDASASGPVELPDLPPSAADLAWLPDGSTLIYRQGGMFGATERGLGPSALRDTLFTLDIESGHRQVIMPAAIGAVSPAVAPDGVRIAFFAPDDDEQDQPWLMERYQLWITDFSGSDPVQLTSLEGIVPLRVRWTPDGEHLLYSARGRIWRVAVSGGASEEIPFRARIAFQQERGQPPVRFPEQGAECSARGHRGIALSLDGERIAVIALGRLWVWPVDGEPEAVATVPPTASAPTWSPDGTEIAWSAGSMGVEELYATDLSTGRSRQLTALPETAYAPVWSPDGSRIAFLHAMGDQQPLRLALIESGAQMASDTTEIHYLASLRAPFIMEEQFGRAVWHSDGDRLLLFGDAPPRIIHLDGSEESLTGFPGMLSALQWADEATLVFTRDNILWRAEVSGGSVSEPHALTEHAAMFVSANQAGSILYISDDGYRIMTLDGEATLLGWPNIPYQVVDAPPLLIRNAQIIDGTGAEPRGALEIYVEEGRIAQLATAGSLAPPADAIVVDAAGRTVIPGLIDGHWHDPEPISGAGALYWGVTTVLDLGSDLADAAAYSEEVRSGLVPGPRYVFGGLMLIPGASGEMDGFSSTRFQGSSDPAAYGRAIALLTAFGGSHVKMHNAASLAGGTELIRQARHAGLRVGGHAPRFLSFFAEGVNEQQHHLSGELYDDFVQLFASSAVGVVPTFVVATAQSHLFSDTTRVAQADVVSFMSPHHKRRAERVMECMGPWRGCTDDPPGRSSVMRLHRAGVPIGVGTDYSVVPVPGILHWELEELVAAGLTPSEAITAATATAARLMGAGDEIGTIEEGKWADLVILDADPLEDIRNTRQIWKVIQGGQVVDREGLLEWARGQK